jgi:hypothetical protein
MSERANRHHRKPAISRRPSRARRTRAAESARRIRPLVWAVALAAAAFAVGVVTAFSNRVATPAGVEHAVSHHGAQAARSSLDRRAQGPPESIASDPQPAPSARIAAVVDPKLRSVPASAAAIATHPSVDSRSAADLHILETEAARRAESLGLSFSPDTKTRSSGTAPSGDDAQSAALAEAFLVDHLIQEAYHSTIFPIGFPAEERTSAAARSQVTGLSPQLRASLLEVALAEPEGERIGPRFEPPESGLIWEGALR